MNFLLLALTLSSASISLADEKLHFSLHFEIENQGAFCRGAPRDFEVRCSPVELGDDLEAAKKTFAEYCRSGFKNLLQHTKCECEEPAPDAEGRDTPRRAGLKVPKFRTTATPKISGANLGFYSGPANGAAFFIFKDGKPDAWSDGENISCSNIDQTLPK